MGELDGHSRVSFRSRIIYTTDDNCEQKTYGPHHGNSRFGVAPEGICRCPGMPPSRGGAGGARAAMRRPVNRRRVSAIKYIVRQISERKS